MHPVCVTFTLISSSSSSSCLTWESACIYIELQSATIYKAQLCGQDIAGSCVFWAYAWRSASSKCWKLTSRWVREGLRGDARGWGCGRESLWSSCKRTKSGFRWSCVAASFTNHGVEIPGTIHLHCILGAQGVACSSKLVNNELLAADSALCTCPWMHALNRRTWALLCVSCNSFSIVFHSLDRISRPLSRMQASSLFLPTTRPCSSWRHTRIQAKCFAVSSLHRVPKSLSRGTLKRNSTSCSVCKLCCTQRAHKCFRPIQPAVEIKNATSSLSQSSTVDGRHLDLFLIHHIPIVGFKTHSCKETCFRKFRSS